MMTKVVHFALNLIPFELIAILMGCGAIFFFLFVLSPRDDGSIDPKILGKVKIIEINRDSTIVENLYGIRVKVKEVVEDSYLGKEKELEFVNHSYQFKQ